MEKLTLQPTGVPTRKVVGGGIGGALSILVIWGLGHVTTVPPEVASAITWVSTFVASYFTKERVG